MNELASHYEHANATSQEDLKAATDFCAGVLVDDLVEVPEAIVIDVGVLANRGWAVIESNAALSSGIYGCDAGKVLPLLLRACKPN